MKAEDKDKIITKIHELFGKGAPKDDVVHKAAEEFGIEPDKMEDMI